jgi:diaminohydroxyphosphoribosylaminopyrimidine deaminase/5-amino-6-(5-phosphoribosylamino)uracil reductase
MVGCVVVDSQGTIVGEGFHAEPGTPHAEGHALAQAGPLAAGATVYVTLEPCAHQGRTPPCAETLVESRVSRVVAAMKDPDNRVNGKGIEILRGAGISVEVGLLGDAARSLNAAYYKQRTTGLPWVLFTGK